MATSLLDWIIDLMRDGSAREAFNTNPQAAMASSGFTNVCGSDVRPFLLDEPSIREVGGVDLPLQSEPDIKYIVNNYTVESPSVAGANNPPPINQTGDGNTATVTDESTDTVEDNDTTNDSSVDSSTDTDTSSDDDTRSEADNIVTGTGNAGEDRISNSTLTDIGEGINGDDNTSVLTLTDNLNDLHVLSDLVNVGDVLNGSPILNGSLNELVDDSLNNLAQNAAQDLNDLINVLS